MLLIIYEFTAGNVYLTYIIKIKSKYNMSVKLFNAKRVFDYDTIGNTFLHNLHFKKNIIIGVYKNCSLNKN